MGLPSDFIVGCIIVGLLLIAMTLAGSFIARLPLSAAMLYPGTGVAIGPLGLGLIKLGAIKNVAITATRAHILMRKPFAMMSNASGLSHCLVPENFPSTRPCASTSSVRGSRSAPSMFSKNSLLSMKLLKVVLDC